MRIPISIVLVAYVILAPSLVWAQTDPTTPPPQTAGGPPNVKPPTKAPTEPLPPTPLLGGEVTVSTTSGAVGPVTKPAGSFDTSSTQSALPLAAFTIGAVLLIIGVGGYLWRQKRPGM